MIELPNKKYQIIYADPPWEYEHPISESRKIENQYPTMLLSDIKNLAVPSDENCILFLWVTAPKLLEGMEVLTSWGFNYRTCLVWDKINIGMGYWFRSQHELLLIGTKGDVHPPNPTARISSVFKEKRGKHSEKPLKIREWIKLWYPDFTRIELFSRVHIEGWDAWGNQVPPHCQKLLLQSNAQIGDYV